MGNQSCQSNVEQVENNLKSVSRQFDIYKKTNQGGQEQTIIAEDKAKKKLYVVQSFIFSNQVEMEQFIKKMKIFKKLKHQNLIKLKKVQRGEYNQMCSDSLFVNLFFEHYERNLLSEFMFRSLTKQTLFTLEEITFILKSLVSALAYLQIHKIAYQNLTLKSIFITNEGNIKLNEHIFTKQYQKENFQNSSKPIIDQSTRLSIQNQQYTSQFHYKEQIQSQQSKQQNFNSQNIYKENVFQLGCLILNLCVNQSVGTLFYQNNDIASSDFINQQLSLVQKLYSSDFAQILYKMLVKNEQKRPDFIELAEILGVINKSANVDIQNDGIQHNKCNMSSSNSISSDQKEKDQDILHDYQYKLYERGVQNNQQNSNKLLLSICQRNDAQLSQQCPQYKQTKFVDSYTPCQNQLLQENEFMKTDNQQQPSPHHITIQQNKNSQYNYGQISSYQQIQQRNYEQQYNQGIENFQQNQYEINNNIDVGEANQLIIREQKELEERKKSVLISTFNSSQIKSVQIDKIDKDITHSQQKIHKNQFLQSSQSKYDQQHLQNESIIIYESNKTSFRDKLVSNGSVIIESIDGTRQNNSSFQNIDNQFEINKNLERVELYHQEQSTEIGEKKLKQKIFPFKNDYLEVSCKQIEEEETKQKKFNQYKEKFNTDEYKMNCRDNTIQYGNQLSLNHKQSDYVDSNQQKLSVKKGYDFQNQLQNEIDSDDFQQIQSVAEFYKKDLEGEGVILLQNDFRFYGYFIQGKAQGKCYILDQSDQIIYEGYYQDGVLKNN
ncbi:hypothetical protein ABPG74_022800 [Tetrahymena malaccensis]